MSNQYGQARNMLRTPVPKVFAWSSRANENPVGAEYIIMEKAPGVQLDELWPNMDIKARFEVVKAIASFQNAWASTSFSQYGSLYYSFDIDRENACILTKSDGSRNTEPRFTVGPSVGRDMLDDGRIAVDFDRGPCKLTRRSYWDMLTGNIRGHCQAV